MHMCFSKSVLQQYRELQSGETTLLCFFFYIIWECNYYSSSTALFQTAVFTDNLRVFLVGIYAYWSMHK